MALTRSGLLLSVGGDVLAKYGTFTRRYQTPTRGGEELKELFTRSGPGATAINAAGLCVPYQANYPRVTYATDPVSGKPQRYLLLENVGATNLVENGDCEADIVGWVLNASSTLARDNAQAFNGSWSCKITTGNATFSGCSLTPRAGGRFAATVGTTYTFSMWVYGTGAAIGTSWRPDIQWWNNTPAVISSSTGTSTPLVAGWQRLSVTAVAPAATVTALPFFTPPLNLGAGIIVWCDVPQFEAGLQATSTIPTLTGSVTRGVESFSVPWFVSVGPQFVYARWLHLAAVPASGFPVIWELSSSTAEGFPRWVNYFNQDGTPHMVMHNVTNNDHGVSVSPSIGQVVETLSFVNADLSGAFRASLNGAADVVAAGPWAAQTVPPTWKAPATLSIGAAQGGAVTPLAAMALSRLLIGRLLDDRGNPTVSVLADARAIAI